MTVIRRTIDDVDDPKLTEDRRRLDEFHRTREAVSFDEIKTWVESWGTDKEVPRPRPRLFHLSQKRSR